ncbi:MAG TPA: NAD-dependent epimerase/dehydratase family protein [Streptosporangiaceae bacterium]|jgi:nucleoside-diphosphate-sugar epimerase
MRLLILGGTWFLGRTLAEQALARDWQVTTFSRGRSGCDVPGTEAIRGDRARGPDLAALASAGPWDAVVDTSGFMPEMVATSSEILRPVSDRYVYLSTVNAYRGWPSEPLNDESPIFDADSSTVKEGVDASQGSSPAYGPLKAACERAARRQFQNDDCLILRPSVVLGPYEYVGRLPWLLNHMSKGGPVLAAGDPARPIQPIDVRDLARFILLAISGQLHGTMNVAAPIGHATYGTLINTCNEVTGSRAELVWVTDEWLSGQDVTPWTEIPLWRLTPGAWAVSSDRAERAGLTCRCLEYTVADTWEWLSREQPIPHERANEIGLAPAKEQRLIAAWQSRAGTTGR